MLDQKTTDLSATNFIWPVNRHTKVAGAEREMAFQSAPPKTIRPDNVSLTKWLISTSIIRW